MVWKPYMRRTAFERAMLTPVQQLRDMNRRAAQNRALERLRDADARKTVEGDTDGNHDNEERSDGRTV